MFEKFIEFHKTGKQHYHKDDDTESTVSSTSSGNRRKYQQTEGFGSFMIFFFCIIFALIGGLVGFRWCKSMIDTSK